MHHPHLLECLSAREFKAAVRALGIDIKKKDVDRLVAEVEKDIKDTVNFEEFVSLIRPMLPNKRSREEIMNLFKLYDVDNMGKISLSNLKRIAMQIGENITDEELNRMIQEADKDKDGAIGPEDFYRVIKRTFAEDIAEFDD